MTKLHIVAIDEIQVKSQKDRNIDTRSKYLQRLDTLTGEQRKKNYIIKSDAGNIWYSD